ncbi:MAG TPA: ABC transporter permease [Thermoanaerobaculia bacterium]|nr:ABC transporter permease [Thermoanaerobaculia bacterium]
MLSNLVPSALRSLVRNPGPSAAAILVLTLGVGLTTTMFSMVDGFLLQQLPVEDGERVLHLGLSRPDRSENVPVSDFVTWRREQRSFEDLAAFVFAGVSLSDGARAERYSGARITANAFELLRVAPALGRGFDERDDRPGASPVILLGHSVWQSHFGGEDDVVGRSVLVDGVPATVVGVMPEGFHFPLREDVWLPLRPDPDPASGGMGPAVDVFGRLRPEATLDGVRLEMNLLARRIAEDRGEAAQARRVAVVPYAQEFMGGSRRDSTIWIGLGAGLFVLLISCANVGNLLLARAQTRTREIALHAVLGAARGRLLLRSLIESLCLALPASALGLGLAVLGIRLLGRAVARAGQRDWPYWIDLGVGGREVLIGLGLALLATLLTGLLPGLRAARLDLSAALGGSFTGATRRSGRLSGGLVSAQVALASVLLVGTGLMVRSLINLATLDVLFDAERVLAARIGLPEEHYPDDASRVRFWRSLREDLHGLTGVDAAALTEAVPGPYVTGRVTYRTPEARSVEAGEAPWTHRTAISPGFFDALGVDLLEGRDFRDSDDLAAERVVIVNRSLAQREWPEASPLGRQLLLGEDPAEAQAVTVVGVAPDLLMDGLRDRFRAGLCLPSSQTPGRSMSVTVRTAGDPMALVPAIRERVVDLDPGLPLYDVTTVRGLLTEGMFYYRMVATIFTVLGVASLLFAATGLYAVLAFSVSRRTREMGIRMAFGAAARDVRRLIVRQGVVRVVVGLAIGLLIAPLFALGLSRQLFDVRPLDPVTFVTIPVLLIAVGAIASLAPAMRATRADPARALRQE